MNAPQKIVPQIGDETPQEHIRNALAILETAGSGCDNQHGVIVSLTFPADAYDAICNRLRTAVVQLEGK